MGKGLRTVPQRSAGGPSWSSSSTSSSSIRRDFSRIRSTPLAVKAAATERRSRVWSGGSRWPTAPRLGTKCGASRVTGRSLTASRLNRGSSVTLRTSSYRVTSQAQPSPSGSWMRVTGASCISSVRTGSKSTPARRSAGQCRIGGRVSVIVSSVISRRLFGAPTPPSPPRETGPLHDHPRGRRSRAGLRRTGRSKGARLRRAPAAVRDARHVDPIGQLRQLDRQARPPCPRRARPPRPRRGAATDHPPCATACSHRRQPPARSRGRRRSEAESLRGSHTGS